jgi:hypothetical protein
LTTLLATLQYPIDIDFKTISASVVDVIEINIALCLKSIGLDNVILDDTDTFVDSVGLVDVIEIDTRLCLNSVSFPSIILNDTGTPVLVSDE